MADVPVSESPKSMEVTLDTADVAAQYEDIMESPTKADSKVIVSTAVIAEQHNLALSESNQLDEKTDIPAPVA